MINLFAAIKRAFKTGIMLQPKAYPVAVPVELDFSSVGTVEIDLWTQQTDNQLDFVQSIYVSNYDNADVLTITFPGGQVIHVPAGAEGYYPASAEFGKFTAKFETQADDGLIIPIVLLNVPVASQQWGPITVTAVPFTPVNVQLSGNGLVLSGASETLINANPARKGFLIEAPTGNNGSIWINFGGGPAAADETSFEITPGGYFPPAGAAFTYTTQEVTVIGTAADLVVCKEFL